MAARGARIARVEATVREPVERHRRTAGEDHAEKNAEQIEPIEPFTLFSLPRQRRGDERERQRKQSVAETNHLQQRSNTVEHAFSIATRARDVNGEVSGRAGQLFATASAGLVPVER